MTNRQDRQRSDGIRRAVLQTVAKNHARVHKQTTTKKLKEKYSFVVSITRHQQNV